MREIVAAHAGVVALAGFVLVALWAVFVRGGEGRWWGNNSKSNKNQGKPATAQAKRVAVPALNLSRLGRHNPAHNPALRFRPRSRSLAPPPHDHIELGDAAQQQQPSPHGLAPLSPSVPVVVRRSPRAHAHSAPQLRSRSTSPPPRWGGPRAPSQPSLARGSFAGLRDKPFATSLVQLPHKPAHPRARPRRHSLANSSKVQTQACARGSSPPEGMVTQRGPGAPRPPQADTDGKALRVIRAQKMGSSLILTNHKATRVFKEVSEAERGFYQRCRAAYGGEAGAITSLLDLHLVPLYYGTTAVTPLARPPNATPRYRVCHDDGLNLPHPSRLPSNATTALNTNANPTLGEEEEEGGEEGEEGEEGGAEEMQGPVTRVIVLENLCFGMRRPAVADFKLGDEPVGLHEGEPGFAALRALHAVATHTRKAVLKRWEELKDQGHNGKVTAAALGLDAPWLTSSDIKLVMKSWKQQQAIAGSTAATVGFRCCGMHGNGVDIDKGKGKVMSKEELASAVAQFTMRSRVLQTTIATRLAQMERWFRANRDFRSYASSVVVVFDQQAPEVCRVVLVDFAHVHEVQDEADLGDVPPNEGIALALANLRAMVLTNPR